MIKSTMDELLNGTLWDRAEAYHNALPWDNIKVAAMNALCVYVVRESETILYVGRSGSPVNRLYEHLGLISRSSISSLGYLIEANLPESRNWQIELMSVADCASYIKALCSDFILELCDAEVAEEAAIKTLHPCLNVIYNESPTPIPDHIRRRSRIPYKRNPNRPAYNMPDFVKELQKELGL